MSLFYVPAAEIGILDMEDLPPNTKMIFLVGSPRSGTTWLQLLLSATPSIATVTETHLFAAYTQSLFARWEGFRDQKLSVGLHHIISEAEFLGLIRELASKVMARILAAKPGATIVLEKTPNHLLYWRDILAVFPDACFIHLIRDPRSVVASLRAARRTGGPDWFWVPRRISDNCSLWSARVKAGREIGAATKNYLELRYEDLREDGGRTLKSAFSWCGVDVSDTEIAEILQQHQIERLRSRQTPGAAWPFDSRVVEFFRRGEVDGWRSDLTRRQIAVVERLTADLMADLGYTPVTVGAGARRRATILPILIYDRLRRGLAWRVHRFGETLAPRDYISWGINKNFASGVGDSRRDER